MQALALGLFIRCFGEGLLWAFDLPTIREELVALQMDAGVAVEW